MTLNRVKLGRAVTLMKYLASAVLNISIKKLNLEKNHVFGIKFDETCRAGGI